MLKDFETTTEIKIENDSIHEILKRNLLVIIPAISTVLIIGTIALVIFMCKTKKVVKPKTEGQDMEMQENYYDHYYSTPDTPEQIARAQMEQLRRELRGIYQNC
jgi:hypothetical protein